MIEHTNTVAQWWLDWMWPMFWQVSVLVALVGLLDLFILRWSWPDVRYALWLLILVKLVLPPSLSLPTSITSKLRPLVRQVTKKQVDVSEDGSLSGIGRKSTVANLMSDTAHKITTILPGAGNADLVSAHYRKVATGMTTPVVKRAFSLQVYLMGTWLLGTLVFALWLIVKSQQLWKTHSMETGKAELPQRFKELLVDTTKKLNLRKAPRVTVSQEIACPAVFGLFRPVLLIPKRNMILLSGKTTEHILLHELAHIKRGDLWLHWAYLVLQTIYWFNPLLWLVRRRLRYLRELCCDAMVARILPESTANYTKTILEIARQVVTKPVVRGIGLLGLFENSGHLQIRLNRLEKSTLNRRKLRLCITWALVVLMFVCVLPMAEAKMSADKSVVAGEQPVIPVVERKCSLEVEVLGSNGRSVEGTQITLWRLTGSSEKAKRLRTSPKHIYWDERNSGKIWLPYGHHQVKHKTVFEELEPGEYRASACTIKKKDADPSPVGVSRSVSLNARDFEASVTVVLKGKYETIFKFVDAETNKTVPNASLILFRDDGLPIGRGSRNFLNTADQSGIFCFKHLDAGAYWIKAERRAWKYGMTEYIIEDERIRINIGQDSKNLMTIPLNQASFSPAEIETRWPWSVTGIVMDEKGKPLESVHLWVNCGQGTLLRKGETITDKDGRYVLRFGPGLQILKEETGEWVVGLQAATVLASKAGYYEANLCRQGDLTMTDKIPEMHGEPNHYFANIVLPNKPYKLDFLMLPAATINGCIKDGEGQPLPDLSFRLTGNELFPSSSVLANIHSDKEGRFVLRDVPLKSFWFAMTCEKGREVTTELIVWSKPREYEVKLIYDKYSSEEQMFQCELVTEPN